MKWIRAIPACVAGVLLSSAAPAQINGSFEADPNLQQPSGWLVTGGIVYVTNEPDDLFPSDGNKYLVVDSSEIGPATPGYGPHGWASAGQARQVVMRPPGPFCSISVDWDYLPGEPVPHPFYNDFLSIDVIHGITGALITNVVYIDSGVTAGTPPYTNVPGAGAGVVTWVPNQSTRYPFTFGMQAPAGFKRAVTDLSAVPVGTPMSIEITVGNGGDSEGPSRAYIDRLIVSAGQQNFLAGNASLRILGSRHFDGLIGNLSWADDTLFGAPYLLRTCAGQRLSFRVSGPAGHPWVMVGGQRLDIGTPTAIGQVNVDLLGSPYVVDPLGLPATLGTSPAWFDFDVPEAVSAGTRITFQAAMEQPGGAYAATAATTVEIGAPQIPVGGTAVGGGGAGNDGFTNQAFAAFGNGSWPFFGVARSSVNVNSNGSVSFGAGDASPAETESGMATGPARIAAIWDDLVPSAGGQVRTTQTAKTWTVSWTATPEAAAGLRGNNFAIQLYQGAGGTPPGAFTIYFGSTTMEDGLTGVSPGGLAAPAPDSSNVNWTSLGASNGLRGVIPAGTAKYERFAVADSGALRDTLDLMSIGGVSRITFVPNGAGYTYFVGTR